MSFLKELITSPLSEAKDLSELPEDAMKGIQKNIRNGAKDLDQKWANALELVHKAYEVANVQRPEPDMSAAWKQYEENIQYAVQQLAKTRGINGDWRMSSSTLSESASKMLSFRVHAELPDEPVTDAIVQAEHIDDVVHAIKRALKTHPKSRDLKIKVEDKFKGKELTFWYHGVRRNAKVTINIA